MSQRFEYKIEQASAKGMGMMAGQAKYRDNDVDMLNRLGRDGWECYHAKTDSFPIIYYLKRRI
jgi:hypothetical protein